jgi:outer membrane protein assembly factor BamB
MKDGPNTRGTENRSAERFPPRRILVACGLLVAIGVVIRQTGVVGDNAYANIITLVTAFIAVVVAGGWFVCRSGYSRAARFGVLAAALLTPCLLLVVFEIKHVSGEMVPSFGFRFAPEPDGLLDQFHANTPGQRADLVGSARDFPQFLGPDRNARYDAIRISPDWISQPPRLVWQQPIGAGWSAFSAVNGFAVTMEQRGEEELVTCYAIETGQLVWSFATQARHATFLGGVGPRSTPTIDGGRVYSLGATGTVLCLEGSNGELVWSDNLLKRVGLTPRDDRRGIFWGRASSPLIVDNLLVVPAGGPANGQHRSLIAYQKDTGNVVWESGDRQASYSSPALATVAGTRQILIVNEDSVSGHDPTSGTVLWDYPWPGNSTQDANNSQPLVVGSDRVLVSKGYNGGAMMLQLSAGAGKKLAVEEVWRNKQVLKTKLANVVHHDGYLYGLSDGILECVDASDGKRQWKRGRYYHGQVLGVGGLLLIQEERGDVVLVEATPDRWNESARIKALNGKTWNNPCIYDRYLLVRNAEQACCFELPLQ